MTDEYKGKPIWKWWLEHSEKHLDIRIMMALSSIQHTENQIAKMRQQLEALRETLALKTGETPEDTPEMAGGIISHWEYVIEAHKSLDKHLRRIATILEARKFMAPFNVIMRGGEIRDEHLTPFDDTLTDRDDEGEWQ